MALIRTLKRLIGLDGERRESGGTSVPVEREPATETERAVKEPVSASADLAAEPEAELTASEPEAAHQPVDTIPGIGPAYADRLEAAGITTVGELAAADAAELADVTDLGEGRLGNWIEAARAE